MLANFYAPRVVRFAQIAVMSGRRPVVKGGFEAVVNVSGSVNCLRPVDAERMNPLALMIRPRGSSPHHSVALVLALTAIRASRPLPLSSHRFVDALDADHLASSEKLLSNSLVVQAATGRSSYWPPRVISAKTMRATLVGERHRCQLELVLDSLALEHAARPQAHGVVMAYAMTKRRASAL